MAKTRTVRTFFFNESEVAKVGNKLANLETRKPHDSLRLLIVEEGTKKIERLQAEKANPEHR